MNENAVALELFKVAEVELIYKGHRSQYRPVIDRVEKAYEILRDTWDVNKIELVEQFKIILLDRSSKCLGISEMASGGITACYVDPKIVFATALKARATGLILAHNHPSGNLMESSADIALTRKLVDAGKFLDITVTDHLILTAAGFKSFADEGLMP